MKKTSVSAMWNGKAMENALEKGHWVALTVKEQSLLRKDLQACVLYSVFPNSKDIWNTLHDFVTVVHI